MTLRSLLANSTPRPGYSCRIASFIGIRSLLFFVIVAFCSVAILVGIRCFALVGRTYLLHLILVAFFSIEGSDGIMFLFTSCFLQDCKFRWHQICVAFVLFAFCITANFVGIRSFVLCCISPLLFFSSISASVQASLSSDLCFRPALSRRVIVFALIFVFSERLQECVA